MTTGDLATSGFRRDVSRVNSSWPYPETRLMRQAILSLIGIFALLFGMLFVLQGLGAVRWPASSMMIGSQTWVIRGGVLMLVGAVLIGGARLLPRRAGRSTLRDSE